jgi:hypothetical protein
VDVIKEVVEKENIDCDFVVTRAVDVQFKDSFRDKLKAGYDRLIESGVTATKGVSYTSDDKAEAVSSESGLCSHFSDSSKDLWCEKSQRLLYLYYWDYLALQVRLTSPDESHLARSESPNTHFCPPGLIKSRLRRLLDFDHRSRCH